MRKNLKISTVKLICFWYKSKIVFVDISFLIKIQMKADIFSHMSPLASEIQLGLNQMNRKDNPANQCKGRL